MTDLPPLVAMPVAGRVEQLRGAMAEAELDCVLVTKPVNVRWLSGFTGSNGALVVTTGSLCLITDGRYEQQAADQLDAVSVRAEIVITAAGPDDEVAGRLSAGQRLGLEADHLTWSALQRLAAALPTIELVPTSGLIEELRKHKDDGERSRLVRAAAIADAALVDLAPELSAGPTEAEFARALDHRMRTLGADDVSFETIVAAGANAALPHHRPGHVVIEPTDLVVVDFGAKIDGYGSDMTRTFVAGGEPSARQQSLYDAVAEAQAAGVATVADGIEQLAVDRACREVLERHGLGEAFIHGTGHGLGLEIHEQPIISARSVGILATGLIVTVEPGAYLPGFGGVRVEDTVVVTADGCEPITHCPKGLIPTLS